MPNKRKVYQKKKAIRRKFALMKFFFWPLYAIFRQFKQCPHNIVSGTDAPIFKAGVSPARPFFLILFAGQDSAPVETDTSGPVKFRAGQGALTVGPLHAIIILILALLFFFAGCQAIQQKEPLTEYEKMQLRQNILFDFFNAWRLEQDEQELLNRERNRDGKENISKKENGPGSCTRQRSISNQGTAEGLANQYRSKSEGRSGPCVETAKTEESEKACSEQSRQRVSFEKVGGSIC